MNNMYDILAKLDSVSKKTLTEGAKPDFLDLDKDGNRKEPMKQAARQAKNIDEADMEEGNEFSGALAQAKASGAKEFKVDGKTYPVRESVEEIAEGFVDFFDKKQMYKKIGADVDGRADDYTVTFRDGTRKRYQEVDGRKRVTTLEPIERNDAVDDQGEVVKRGRGRPKGTGRSIGTRGVTDVRAKKKMAEDYDKDEYDEEGEMAMSQSRTIEDAAKELQDILDADENLPEWVQKKITLAQEYIDSARDYLKANRPEGEEEMDVEITGDEEIMAEKAVSKAQRAAAGIARAAQKGEIPKSELRGASKEMAKMPAGELKKFAKTKEKGLPEKVKEEDKEEVEETTTSGSVAPASTGGKSKGIFGKGVYEGAIAESFDAKLKNILNEGMSINMSMGDNGEKSLSVNATEDDAVKLAQLLKLAGMQSASEYQDVCPACGQTPCGCDQIEEAELANSANNTQKMDTHYMTQELSGGLNGPKTTGQTTVPVINRDAERQGVMGKRDSGILEATEQRLMDLYKKYEGK